jgi:DNA helicase-2/ATP-dependent DNA helicase PcrA
MIWRTPMARVSIDLGEVKATPVSKPSKYQQALFDFIVEGQGSAIVEAVAGSGKTTTIVQALNLIPSTKRAIFLAFNKAIAEELQMRVPEHATAATFHSAGMKAWKRANPRSILQDRKCRDIMKRLVPYEFRTEIGEPALRLVSLAKQSGIRCLMPDVTQAWEALIDHYDLDVKWDKRREVIVIATMILDQSIALSDREIDFDDMLYMTILKKVPVYTYDWVFVDEAQDTNGVRRALAKRLLAPGGRLVAVGDSAQAIYGFTGADSDAIELIGREFDAETFPLSICYRSAKRIVQEAKAFVPGIEAAPKAPLGVVKATTFKETPPGDGDAILCRNTAPLIDLAYTFISEGRGCKILGRDIGKGLVRLIEMMKATNLDDLHDKLGEYRDREVKRFLKEEKEARAQSVEDKVECIFAVIRNIWVTEGKDKATIKSICEHIDRLFQDNGDQILTLSTVHKAKGLEWTRVYVYRRDLMPSKWARQPWQMRQEANLQYVATTRAKRELYYVSDGGR